MRSFVFVIFCLFLLVAAAVGHSPAYSQVKTSPGTATTSVMSGVYGWASPWGLITLAITGKDGDLLQGSIAGPSGSWKRDFDKVSGAATVITKVMPDGAVRIFAIKNDPERYTYELRQSGKNLVGKHWDQHFAPHAVVFTRQ